jgi:hypothetical protein
MPELNLPKQHRLLGMLLRVKNIAQVLPKMTNSAELPVPGIARKRTLKAKAVHQTSSAWIIPGEDVSQPMPIGGDKFIEQ